MCWIKQRNLASHPKSNFWLSYCWKTHILISSHEACAYIMWNCSFILKLVVCRWAVMMFNINRRSSFITCPVQEATFISLVRYVELTIIVNNTGSLVRVSVSPASQLWWAMSEFYGIFSGFSRFPNFIQSTLFTDPSTNCISFIIFIIVFPKTLPGCHRWPWT